MKTIDKTVRILDALVEAEGSRVSELSDRLEMPTSTVHAHLSALKRHGFVRSDGDIYTLGLQFLYYGGHILHNKREYELVRPRVSALAERTGERVQFIVEHGGRGIYLYTSAEGERAVQADVRMGKIADLAPTAAGKAILAYLPESTVREILDEHGLEAHTENSITDEDELFAELDAVRERGYSINDEERIHKQIAVGAAILDRAGGVVGGLSVSGPAHRMRAERYQDEIVDLLLGTVDEIELNIIYQ
ncbi:MULTISPECIES: IclR family transcriptional regulator [Haloprofundus]|uniref:IclR family transcriptional regulator n=1 Tax=Haloprofundus TaxID=1911573 RepID=UPI000E4392AD|nr:MULTISPECIES: IclR family transcriptional regulator [Haloprofundus]